MHAVVVGAGASGLMVAAAVLGGDGSARVTLVDRRPHDGGLAYGCPDATLLLNVRAGALAAPGDDADGFVRWARGRDAAVTTMSFLPRRWYGEYLTGFAAEVGRDRLRRVWGGVHRLVDDRGRLRVSLDGGAVLDPDVVVLALGNAPPAPLRGGRHRPGRPLDPLDPAVLARVGVDDPVSVVGSSLTAVDVLLALTARGHVGPVTMVSRHGRLPLAHCACACPATPSEAFARLAAGRVGIDALVATVRTEVRDAVRSGRCWQPAFDALRPHAGALWAALDDTDRRRFLDRHRHGFDRLRHRVAPEVAAAVAGHLRSGRLTVRCGYVGGEATGRRLAPVPGPAGEARAGARWVFNATGPDPRTPALGPLVARLVADGRARPGWAGLGLDVTDDGQVRDGGGRPNPRLWALGPPCRGNRWETTAVPELREQARRVAVLLATRAAVA